MNATNDPLSERGLDVRADPDRKHLLDHNVDRARNAYRECGSPDGAVVMILDVRDRVARRIAETVGGKRSIDRLRTECWS